MTGRNPITVTGEMGFFSIIPEWVLDAEISDRAIRLYGVLARYADKSGERDCEVYRSTLAKRLRCSSDSIDRAVAELVSIGALVVERQRIEGRKEYGPSRYYLKQVNPNPPIEVAAVVRPGDRDDAARGGRTGAAENESHLELEKRSDSHESPPSSREDEPPSGETERQRAKRELDEQAETITNRFWEWIKTRDGHPPAYEYIPVRRIVRRTLADGFTVQQIKLGLARIHEAARSIPITKLTLRDAMDGKGSTGPPPKKPGTNESWIDQAHEQNLEYLAGESS